jgi:GNAT superfamily N-acetyltransferase
MTVRPGIQADIAAAEDVWRLSITERDGAPPTAETAATVGDILRADTSQLFVAEEDGEIVGMACTTPGRAGGVARGPVNPELCHLQMVFVRPSHWGGGIGGQLLDAVLEHARSIGQTRAQLWVVEDNERATRLYVRRGFAHTGTVIEENGMAIGLWSRKL